ncbi:MAG: hypothetical protein WKF94_07925 [Solirubrobacteraceae bacterium]
MKVTMLLADAAQAVDGKLNVLGGGWTFTGPQPVPSAIGIVVDVPWDRANQQLPYVLELLDSDGDSVVADGPDGEAPVRVEGVFEVGRPAGVKPGTSLALTMAINLAPMPLEPGGRYEWRLTVAGESHQDWRLPFSVRTG